jgi:tetrahydromethanopterin S-methyltransferase subunit G
MLALLEQNLVLTQRVEELSRRIENLTAELHQRLMNHEA